MKNLLIVLAAILTVLSLDSYAGSFYQTDFEIVKVEEICPQENGYSCKALGSHVTIKSTLLGCVDKLIDFKYLIVNEDSGLKLVVMGTAYTGFEEIYCIKEKVITKKILIPSQFDNNINLVNDQIVSAFDK